MYFWSLILDFCCPLLEVLKLNNQILFLLFLNRTLYVPEIHHFHVPPHHQNILTHENAGMTESHASEVDFVLLNILIHFL